MFFSVLTNIIYLMSHLKLCLSIDEAYERLSDVDRKNYDSMLLEVTRVIEKNGIGPVRDETRKCLLDYLLQDSVGIDYI
jgi:hypothetical protein